MLKTKKTMQRTNRTPIAIRVRHPVGTNHFQFRCHQFLCGGIDGEGGGGVCSIESFCVRAKTKSSNYMADVLFDFLGKSPRNIQIKSEYVLAALRLSINEEVNTQYGIGSRGSVRVGTGFRNYHHNNHD